MIRLKTNLAITAAALATVALASTSAFAKVTFSPQSNARGNVTPPAPVAPPTLTPAAMTAPATPTVIPATAVIETPPPAPAPAQPAGPKLEFTRTVAADKKLRLDFLYSINPDCTSIGYATVRIIEQPKHGRITVENGTGFTNFAANNLRFECNKQRSEGVAITYEPDPGYLGPDSVNFDAIFAGGTLSKRHYAIDVR